MNTYSCEQCMKFFNGKIPYEAHMESEKHKKMARVPTSIIQGFRHFNFNFSDWEKENIIRLEKDYKCTLCETFLNSVDQVRCHINGGKHLKEKARDELFNKSKVLSRNQSINQVDDCSSSTVTGRAEKHKEKVMEPTAIVQDFRNCSFNSSDWEKDPFIICLEKDYKCTLCKTYLNSKEQVRCHVNGGKHLKEKGRFGLFAESSVLAHNRSSDEVDGESSSSAATGDSRFQFYMQDEEAKELIENMKMFKPDDEIVFNTV